MSKLSLRMDMRATRKRLQEEVEKLPTGAAIELLQATMRALPQVELPTAHHFGGGVYVRELFIPKGHTLVGRTHKKEHLCILVCGDMTVVSDGARARLTGHKIFVSAPGVKRAGYAHEDSIFVTVHRTDSLDLDEIEQETVEPEIDALFDSSNRLLERA